MSGFYIAVAIVVVLLGIAIYMIIFQSQVGGEHENDWMDEHLEWMTGEEQFCPSDDYSTGNKANYPQCEGTGHYLCKECDYFNQDSNTNLINLGESIGVPGDKARVYEPILSVRYLQTFYDIPTGKDKTVRSDKVSNAVDAENIMYQHIAHMVNSGLINFNSEDERSYLMCTLYRKFFPHLVSARISKYLLGEIERPESHTGYFPANPF